MIYVICGPTGVGKTKLSVSLAKHFNGIVVNADSMQVYKDLNIGTAKVTEEEKQNIIKRLNVIEGQIRGIKQMVEDDRYCSDIIMQLSASMHSLKSLGNNMLKSHMKTCMVDNVKNDKLDIIDEVITLVEKINK